MMDLLTAFLATSSQNAGIRDLNVFEGISHVLERFASYLVARNLLGIIHSDNVPVVEQFRLKRCNIGRRLRAFFVLLEFDTILIQRLRFELHVQKLVRGAL